jgi:hypothetical protein
MKSAGTASTDMQLLVLRGMDERLLGLVRCRSSCAGRLRRECGRAVIDGNLTLDIRRVAYRMTNSDLHGQPERRRILNLPQTHQRVNDRGVAASIGDC